MRSTMPKRDRTTRSQQLGSGLGTLITKIPAVLPRKPKKQRHSANNLLSQSILYICGIFQKPTSFRFSVTLIVAVLRLSRRSVS